MGKTTSTTNQRAAAPAKRAIKPTAKTRVAAKVAVAAPPSPPPPAAKKIARPALPKTAVKRSAKSPKPTTPAYTENDVALRAYFIAEKRQAEGLPGDSHQDWIEAERQLAVEATAAKKPKPKPRKS